MAGNTFGRVFTVTSFGESHGPAIGCIVDGCPAGLALTEDDIQPFLDKRKPGTSKFTSQRREADLVRILSGVFEGQTTGAPIALLIENTDAKSKDYDAIKDKFRPGHADYTYHKKYGIRDHRGGGRSSARETAMRVAAGAIAEKILQQRFDLKIKACLTQMGPVHCPPLDWAQTDENPFFCADKSKLPELEAALEQIRKAGDSYGAKIQVVAENVPVGLGEPVFHKLDADIAHAMMGINAVKGVEIGAGFAAVTQTGSEHRDEITPEGFLSNEAGGILGGISSGQPIVVNLALKPTSSIRLPAKTIDIAGHATDIVTTGRHDPCVGLRAVPIARAMMALVLVDHALLLQAT